MLLSIQVDLTRIATNRPSFEKNTDLGGFSIQKDGRPLQIHPMPSGSTPLTTTALQSGIHLIFGRPSRQRITMGIAKEIPAE